MLLEEKLNGDIVICVVDSGIDRNHPLFKDTDILGYEFDDSGKIIKGDCKDNIGHGTAIMGILLKSNSKVKKIMIKIFDEKFESDLGKLIQVLKFIYEHINCHIIHLSLGYNFYDKEMYEICEKITAKGIKIVSAFDNTGAISYPAAFDFVIGVDSSDRCKKNNEFIFIEGSPINIAAKGGLHRVTWKGEKYIITDGISFSAAYVTASMAQMLEKYGVNYDVLSEFKSKAIDKYQFDKRKVKNYEVEICSIRRAAVFPLNKEITSLINFADILSFEIPVIYDVKYYGRIGKIYTGFRGKTENKIIYIENIEKLIKEEVTDYDTLILGHVSEISKVMGRNIKMEILDACLRNKINVYSFDGY